MQVSHHCLVSPRSRGAGNPQHAQQPRRRHHVLNLSPVYSASNSPADKLLASQEDGLLVRWYMDALLRGEYPQDILGFLGADAPAHQNYDAQLIAQPLDFIGVNYYNPIVSVAGRPFSPARAGAPVTDMGWEVAPANFTDLLQRLDRDYELPPLLSLKTARPMLTP